MSFNKEKINIFYNIEYDNGYLCHCDCPDVSGICKHIFLVSKIFNLSYTFAKPCIIEEEQKENEEEVYNEILREEEKLHFEALQESFEKTKKIVLKEIDHPLASQSDVDYKEKSRELEYKIQNMKNFVSTLQKARTPHQTRPQRQT